MGRLKKKIGAVWNVLLHFVFVERSTRLSIDAFFVKDESLKWFRRKQQYSGIFCIRTNFFLERPWSTLLVGCWQIRHQGPPVASSPPGGTLCFFKLNLTLKKQNRKCCWMPTESAESAESIRSPNAVVQHSGSGGSGGGSGGSSSSSSAANRKRSWSRAVFSNLQRKGLEKRFQLQKYITKPDRRQLAATLGLTDAQVASFHTFLSKQFRQWFCFRLLQVKVWFQNRWANNLFG